MWSIEFFQTYSLTFCRKCLQFNEGSLHHQRYNSGPVKSSFGSWVHHEEGYWRPTAFHPLHGDDTLRSVLPWGFSYFKPIYICLQASYVTMSDQFILSTFWAFMAISVQFVFVLSIVCVHIGHLSCLTIHVVIPWITGTTLLLCHRTQEHNPLTCFNFVVYCWSNVNVIITSRTIIGLQRQWFVQMFKVGLQWLILFDKKLWLWFLVGLQFEFSF